MEKEEQINLDENEYLSDFTRFYILVLLYEEPSHGYGLKKKYEERLGKKLNDSMIYPFLAKLEQKNYVKMDIENVGNKEKKMYSLSQNGTLFAESMFKRFAGIIEAAIEPNIQICTGCLIKLYHNSYQETIDGKKYTFCCVHCAQAYKDQFFDRKKQ